MNDDELRAMLIEYMGKGFLENILALMKQDPSLVRFIPDMVGDEAIVVRLGATALIEELAGDRRRSLVDAVPGLVALLGHENPTIRGDAANVLGIIGDPSALPALTERYRDLNAWVRDIAREAVEEIHSTQKKHD
jgi:HEAT repeat protein